MPTSPSQRFAPGPSLSPPPMGGEGKHKRSSANSLKFPQDRFNHAFEVFDYVIVPKPDDSVAMTFKFNRPQVICQLSRRVLSAIELDHEFTARTGKIDNALANRMLVAKAMLDRQFAQRPPQALLGLGCIAPQSSSDPSSWTEFHPATLSTISLRPRGRRG